MKHQTDSAPTIWFEIDDLVRYFTVARPPTGIQRVVTEILLGGGEALGGRARLCRLTYPRKKLVAFDTADFRARIQGAADGKAVATAGTVAARRNKLRYLLRAIIHTPIRRLRDFRYIRRRQREFQAHVRPGDILVNLGSPWEHQNFSETLASYKARYGLRYALLVHDIIPATNPDFCTAAHVSNFANWLATTAAHTDLFFTPSHYSAERLKAYSDEMGWPQKPVVPLRFGTGFSNDPGLAAAVQHIIAPPFVLFVSTIERRKNHIVLLRVWKRLIEKYGAARIPTLLFVGRLGWGVTDLEAELDDTAGLGGKVLLLDNVSNVALAGLYRDAAFTVYPSLAEGWGLPVEESLHYGTVCLCSDASSIPEVGGELAEYFDGRDEDSVFTAVERAIFDTEWLTRKREQVRSEFRAVSWSSTFQAAVDAIDRQLVR